MSAWQLIEPGAVYVVDRHPRALDREVGVVGSEDEDRGCGNRGELLGGEDTFGAWAAEPVDRVHERRHGSGVLRSACGQAQRLDQRVRRGRYFGGAEPLGEQAAVDT